MHTLLHLNPVSKVHGSSLSEFLFSASARDPRFTVKTAASRFDWIAEELMSLVGLLSTRYTQFIPNDRCVKLPTSSV